MPTPDTQSPGSVQEPASEEARTTENFPQQLWLCSWMASLSSGSGDAGGRGSGCQACRSSVRCSLWYVAAVAAAVSVLRGPGCLAKQGLGIGFAWFGSKQKKTMIGKASLCPKHWLQPVALN